MNQFWTKKNLYILFGVFLLAICIACLSGLLMKEEKEVSERRVETITCGEAAKALALAAAEKETCLSDRQNHLTEEEKKQWYAPYLEYVREQGWFEQADGESILTVRMLEAPAAYFGILPDMNEESRASAADFPVEKEGFWVFYRRILTSLGEKNRVQETEITIYGTDQTVFGIPEKTACTDQGYMNYSGLNLEECTDEKLSVLCRDGEIIHVLRLVAERVTYPNVWIAGVTEDSVKVFFSGIDRELSCSLDTEGIAEQIGDVTVSHGELLSLSFPDEEIRGKVLSVSEEGIEIEGYGLLSLDPAAAFYKGYGNYGMQKKEDILVGYDLERFSLKDGRICGGVMTKTFRADNIRVLLCTDGFTGYFHPEVRLEGLDDFYLCYGSTKEFHPAGEVVILHPEDACFQEGRVIVKTVRENRGIRIKSIQREQGEPVYRGTMELNRCDLGITIVNELLLEDYLKEVVPSEVPSTYDQEALNTQAICARSYAWLAIRGNRLREYGAHVDDSENDQVYNNWKENERTTAAVQNTYGQVLTYQEEVIPAYYFSTSWGCTTDPSIWGSAPDGIAYLRPVEVTKSSAEAVITAGEERETRNYADEEVFQRAMEDPGEDAFEFGCEWFRWSVDLTFTQLEASIREGLPIWIQEKRSGIHFRSREGSFQSLDQLSAIPELGKLEEITVAARAGGGSVQELLITGSKGELKVTGQGNVRSFLGNTEYTYQNGKGSSSGNRQLLQSAFFWLEELRDGEERIGYRIHGGGKGHGLGMPQNAMNAMSLYGYSAEEILGYFFPFSSVEQMY